MSTQDTIKAKAQVRESLFKRHENLTVLLIFIGFVATIVLTQLVMSGGREYPTFISPVNILNILQQVSVPGIIAVSMTMVMITRGIDLSVGMLASLVSIIVAMGVSRWGLGVVPSIALGIVSAIVLESLMGFIISRTRVEPFIITLGGMISFQGIALLLSNSREVVMQGELDFLTVSLLGDIRDPVTGLMLRLPSYVLVFGLVALIGGLVLTYTKYGRRLYAVGSNPRAAFLAGINVSNMTLSVYAIQGLLVGIGATMLLARINTGIITLGQGLEIDTIAMVVIGGTALSGGRGNIVGTVIGVLFLGSIANAMNLLRLPSEMQFLAKGVIIVLAVSAGDISGRISDYRALRRERLRTRDASATPATGGEGQ